MSESKQDDESRLWWKEKLKSLLYVRKFKSALVGGCLHKDYLVHLGCSEESVFLGYDVVDNKYFIEQTQRVRENSCHFRRQQHIPKNPYFLTISRFIPRKNILRLIDAFAEYRRMGCPDRLWDLVVCGSGSEENLIRERIIQYQLQDFVHLPGFKTYKEMPKWLGLAGALIHPALSEQWGLVVNEGLASGLPVLVSNRCGCFPELIQEGKNGFGFDPENVQQLSRLMLKMSRRRAELAKMSESSLERIQKFSPKAFGHGLAQSIEYALKH